MGQGRGPFSRVTQVRESQYEQRCDERLAEIRARHPDLDIDEVMRAVEWELGRAEDFERYPIVGDAGAFGTIRANKTERAGGLPSMVVLFTVTENDVIRMFSATLASDLDDAASDDQMPPTGEG